MFYDLNVPWTSNEVEIARTAAFAVELGYDVIALSHTYDGKLPSDLTPPIPANPFPSLPKLKVLRRATLVLEDPSQNHRIAALNAAYDILAVRPTNEKAFAAACTQMDVDLISIDMSVRRPFIFKFKPIAVAVSRGIRLELCYAPVIALTDSHARSNVISNAIQMIRASRSRGLIISSEAKNILSLRSPFDVINLASVWGLPQNKGKQALSIEGRNVAINASMKRHSFKGAVEIVSGGSVAHLIPEPIQQKERSGPTGVSQNNNQKKRKATDTLRATTLQPAEGQKSKRAMKREAKLARLEGVGEPSQVKDADEVAQAPPVMP